MEWASAPPRDRGSEGFSQAQRDSRPASVPLIPEGRLGFQVQTVVDREKREFQAI
jgi:hypothetical protein